MALSSTRVETLLHETDDMLRTQAFEVAAGIAAAAAGNNDALARSLLIRALHRRHALANVSPILDSLAREVGLFPYVQNPGELSTADKIAYEMHRPIGVDDLVFHAEQAEVYRLIADGHNVVLSAPTSFGKSLITDAVIASSRFSTIAIVVPTIALIDETRRRLNRRFGREYKVITHASQRPGERTIYVLTQERLLQLDDMQIDQVEFFVIDEFYKLDKEDEEDRKCHLNQAFHRLHSTGAQFYLLGPRIVSLAAGLQEKLNFRFVYTDFETVVLDTELRDLSNASSVDQLVVETCRQLKGPTLIYVRSPQRAHDIARMLWTGGVGGKSKILNSAGEWVQKAYHPEWVVGQALRNGVGVHHGRVPRALAHHIVRLFNRGQLPFLVVTSTLIEGVNTAAANVVIVDNKCARKNLDFFTFSNICGRSGRMFQHFVGKVIVFNDPPKRRDKPVDIPAISQRAGTSLALLIQLPWNELTSASRELLRPYYEQNIVRMTTFRLASGIDPERIMDVANILRSDPVAWSERLSWTGVPTYEQLRDVSNLVFKLSGTKGRRSGVSSGAQLAFRVDLLRRSRGDIVQMTQAQVDFARRTNPDVSYDAAVDEVLDFTRHWATFHFPRLLLVLEAISSDVFGLYNLEAGKYTYFAGAVEAHFRPPAFAALEEYGLPAPLLDRVIESQPWLVPWLDRDLDVLLNVLREVSDVPGLSDFEADMWADFIAGL